ncbi:tyrosine-type recombinase/integrase [Candidatus Woesearchaeota archaeon]|nr:tyrosine-type recombinase/integrase [Candidatus Woesearchaeota archaeon]
MKHIKTERLVGVMVSDPLYAMKREGLRRGLSHLTIVTYVQCVKQFMKYCQKDLKKVTKKDVGEYIDRIIERGGCGNTVNVHLNAVKFVLQEVLGKRVMLRIRYSKTPKTLPVFLTKDEVLRLLSAVSNPKHLLILELLYSAGLRVGEVVKLRKEDLEFDRCVGWVRAGKGNKDRLFIIADRISGRLREQVVSRGVQGWSFIFPGRNGHLSVRSVQEIVKVAARRANISKNVHPHSLRHSFATHLIENGCGVVEVQPLMGHSSAETTNMYIHMANPPTIRVRSPYDVSKSKTL